MHYIIKQLDDDVFPNKEDAIKYFDKLMMFVEDPAHMELRLPNTWSHGMHLRNWVM